MPRWSRNKDAFQLQERSIIAEMWWDRFGIARNIFNSYSFYRQARNIWAFSNATLPKFSFQAVGLRMMNFKEKPWKPTTSALQVFGRYATRNFIFLDEKEARCFLAGESQSQEANVEPGYIAVFYKDDVLGCALYSKGLLHSQLPKELRIGYEEEMKM